MPELRLVLDIPPQQKPDGSPGGVIDMPQRNAQVVPARLLFTRENPLT